MTKRGIIRIRRMQVSLGNSPTSVTAKLLLSSDLAYRSTNLVVSNKTNDGEGDVVWQDSNDLDGEKIRIKTYVKKTRQDEHREN